MAKTNSISKFSNSLVEFLINSLTDKHGNARAVAQKYNNLKVYMDPAKITTPHFLYQWEYPKLVLLSKTVKN